MSKVFSDFEHNYEIYNKEMLAIMLALGEWRQYLMGILEDFEIWTDHQNLQYFRKPQKLNRRQARWMTELGEYHFKLLHKPGKTHVKPDILSRRPDLDRGEKDNENEILLKKEHFCQMEFIFEDLGGRLCEKNQSVRRVKGSSSRKRATQERQRICRRRQDRHMARTPVRPKEQEAMRGHHKGTS